MSKKFIELFKPKPIQDSCRTCQLSSENKSCDLQIDLNCNFCKNYNPNELINNEKQIFNQQKG